MNQIKAYLPTPQQIVKLAIGLVIIFAIGSATGATQWILDPVNSWKNRKA